MNIEDIDEEQLYAMIQDGAQESLTLDYKRSAALDKTEGKKSELSKDVSAFANSAGGRIIYGIVEQDHLPISIDDGVDPNVISREWLEQVIESKIQPRVQGLKIKPVLLKSGRTLYVVDIPQATSLAPHQASDHRYYRRANFRSVPMEDYEIRDVLRRSSTGNPYLRFSWLRDTDYDGNDARAVVCFQISNRSSEPVMYAHLSVYIDDRLVPEGYTVDHFTVVRNLHVIMPDGSKLKVVQLTKNILPTQHMPLFREQIWSTNLKTLPVPTHGQYYFGYRFSCPGFEHVEGGVVKIEGYELKFATEDMRDLFVPIG